MTREKARVALEKMDGVAAAFVNNSIMLLVNTDDPLDEAALTETLKPFKMKPGEIRKADQLPF